jgi:hypothetical protein
MIRAIIRFVGNSNAVYALAAAALICALEACPAMGENLLRNSSFKLATNQVTPDYWDLHHAAAVRFRDLHTQYNLVDAPQGPVSGARVLKITNSERGFPYLYLLSKLPDAATVEGDYVFSVYAKADRRGNSLQLAPSFDRMGERTNRKMTTDWQRYSAEFRVDQRGRVSPLIALPDAGTYWISAPQLESGARLTPYAAAAEDARLGVQSETQRQAAAAALAQIASAAAASPATKISAVFEFSLYTDEASARLRVSTGSSFQGDATVVCRLLPLAGDAPAVWSFVASLGAAQMKILDVRISGLSPGEYSCTVDGAGGSASARLSIARPHAPTVRVNQFRNTLEVGKSGFQIRGVMIGGYVPPEWYFSDIAEHGINTLFYYPGAGTDGTLKVREMDSVLQLARKYAIKVVIGPAVMGQKNGDWKSLLDRYRNLVARYRNTPDIIGWFAVDEPQRPTLGKNDLVDIYDSIKALDPYRLVFINWNSDDVPAAVGTEPHGSLAATDLYSIDYYPFTNGSTNLETYTLRTLRAQRTGLLAGRPGHSWLQLYGYLDVIREPTGDELNYMAYVNLLYGGNYSYWQTKSNAKPTWDRLGRINEEIRVLTNTLTLNPGASEIQAPTLAGRYLYSAWKTPTDSYLIVLHIGSQPEPFTLDLQPIFGPRISQARIYFGEEPVDMENHRLKDNFAPYATRVYQIN